MVRRSARFYVCHAPPASEPVTPTNLILRSLFSQNFCEH
jgi:hypothetical protein